MSEVLYGRRDDTHVLRYIGDVRYASAPSLGRFVRERLATAEVGTLLIDLTETTFIDSTHLGQIARFGESVRRSGGRFAIVSCRRDVNDVLHSMAFDEVFDVVATADCEAGQRVPADAPNRDALHEEILDAHRALMHMSAANRATFQPVVQMLEQ